MSKLNDVLSLATVAVVVLTLAGCDRPAQKDATPSPTPVPTATPLPTSPQTATPVVVMPSASPAATAVMAATATPAPPASVPPLPPVTDTGMLAGELKAPTLFGRRADLTGLKVDRLVGDRAFYVMVGGSNQRMLVILDTKLNEGVADAELKILPKQTLTIHGVIEKLPEAQEIADKWGVRGNETEPLAGETIYLHADQVTITNGPDAK